MCTHTHTHRNFCDQGWASEDFGNTLYNTPHHLPRACAAGRLIWNGCASGSCEEWYCTKNNNNKNQVSTVYGNFSPPSQGSAGQLHDNSTVISGSPSKGIINAEAGIEHIWNYTIEIFNGHIGKHACSPTGTKGATHMDLIFCVFVNCPAISQ